jgi:hypothetical protein
MFQFNQAAQFIFGEQHNGQRLTECLRHGTVKQCQRVKFTTAEKQEQEP